MKKSLILTCLVATLIFFSSCEEDVTASISVPANFSVTFPVLAETVNADPDNLLSGSQTVDVANLVDADGNQIESIKIDKLTYELSGYNNTSGNFVLADITINTVVDGNDVPILAITGFIVENTGTLLLFEDGNPESALSAAQVASLESIMDNLTPFEIEISGDFTDDIDSNFNIGLAWEITATATAN